MDTEIIKTDLGLFKVLSVDGIIYRAYFLDKKKSVTKQNKSIIVDVKSYFDGSLTKFKSKYKTEGTPFQELVYKEIAKIKYGSTKTYGEIAQAIGRPTAYRAVANACGSNKIALFIPCHRVIGCKTSGGYKWGCERKDWLLQFEKDNK